MKSLPRALCQLEEHGKWSSKEACPAPGTVKYLNSWFDYREENIFNK